MQVTTFAKTGIRVVIAVVLLTVGLELTQKSVLAAAPANAPDILVGITLDHSLAPIDVAYLENSLQLLHDRLPAWWQYVQDAKPFTVMVNVDEGLKGHEAVSSCCDAEGRGTIMFGHRPGYSVDASTAEEQQILFIGTLIHEVTHVRDQREGRFVVKTNFKSCVAAEKSGLSKQLDVKRDWAIVLSNGTYRQVLDQQITQESRDLNSRELWNLYCGVFEN